MDPRFSILTVTDDNGTGLYMLAGGRAYPFIGGSDDDDNPPTDPPAGSRTITQTELDAIATQHAAEGKKAGTAEVMERLGVETAEEAEAIIAAHRKAADAEKTDAQKAREAADAETAAATKAKNEADRARLEANIARRLVKVPGTLTDANETRLVGLIRAELAADADAETIDAKVAQYAEDMAGLWNTDDTGDTGDGDKKKTGAAGTGGQKRPPASSNGSVKSKLQAGAERAAAKRPQKSAA